MTTDQSINCRREKRENLEDNKGGMVVSSQFTRGYIRERSTRLLHVM
jgi:hypothetical protein